MEGTIIRGRGGLYTVRDDQGDEYVLRAKKKFRRQGLSPLVGDRIVFTPGDISDEHGWVEEILPRISQCLRPPVANVTLLCIVMAPQPAPDWMLVDKLLIYAAKQHLKPLLIINKADLDENDQVLQLAKDMYRDAGMEVLSVSAARGLYTEELMQRLEGETCCFSGQSGVGKSTLLNALFDLKVETGDISQKILRGKNTTRHCELFTRGGIRLIDTPGFSLLEMEEVFDPVLLRDYYPEFVSYEGQCRFSPCYHGSEPGCAVLAAGKEGRIHPKRLERYHTLLAECRQAWRERYD
ncbi:MAG: ribosome small subunit-dependent GTPase A [Clostridiales bacterium]|nr:ribosome small subunit-dependent GTPase A [Clostridiales bacterium]